MIIRMMMMMIMIINALLISEQFLNELIIPKSTTGEAKVHRLQKFQFLHKFINDLFPLCCMGEGGEDVSNVLEFLKL